MGWDASRPVPWRRLVKEWVLYAGIMAVVLAVIMRDADRIAADPRRSARSAGRCTSCSASSWPSSATPARRSPTCARPGRRRRPQPPSDDAVPAPRPSGADEAHVDRPQPPAQQEALTAADDVRDRHRRRHDRHPQPGRVRRRPARRVVVPRVRPALPAAGLGRARRDGDLGRRRGRRSSTSSSRSARPRWRPSGSRTSARPSWPGTARRGDRTAGRSCGRTGARRRAATSSPPTAPSTSCASAPGSCSTRTSAARSSSGCCATGVPGQRRPGARHDRRLARLEPHRWRGAGDGHHQRQPHDAVRHHDAAVGPRAVRRCCTSRSSACPPSCRRAAGSG